MNLHVRNHGKQKETGNRTMVFRKKFTVLMLIVFVTAMGLFSVVKEPQEGKSHS